MKVIFYGNRKGDFVDTCIRWWTSSPKAKINGSWRNSYSHVELQFSDGVCFSASPREGTTRFKKSIDSTNWDSVELPITAEKGIRTWCMLQDGKKYDYLGVMGFVMNVAHDKDKWFCSELCTYVLQVVSTREVETLQAEKTSPNALARAFGLLRD